MEGLLHPALQLPPEVKKEQIRNISTLKAHFLTSYLASEPLLCGRAQKRLAADPRRAVQCALAEHPSVLRSIQVELAANPSHYVRRALAGNAALHLEAARILSSDENKYVQLVLALSSNADERVLEGLVESQYPRVRKEVAGNPRTPSERLAALAEDKEREVWFRAVRNPSTPLAALMGTPVSELVKQRYEYGRGSVLEERYQDDPLWEMISSLAQNWEGTLGELLDACERLHPTRIENPNDGKVPCSTLE